MIKEIVIVTIIVLFMVYEKFTKQKNVWIKTIGVLLLILSAFGIYNAWINPIRVYRESKNGMKLLFTEEKLPYCKVGHPIAKILLVKYDPVGVFSFKDYTIKGNKIFFNWAFPMTNQPITIEYEGRRF